MKQVVDLGLHEKTAILAGIGPVKSLAGLEFMRNEVPGMDVPESLLARSAACPKRISRRPGLDLACEIGEELRQIEGVRGLHIMAIGATTMIPELVQTTGALPPPHPLARESCDRVWAT